MLSSLSWLSLRDPEGPEQADISGLGSAGWDPGRYGIGLGSELWEKIFNKLWAHTKIEVELLAKPPTTEDGIDYNVSLKMFVTNESGARAPVSVSSAFVRNIVEYGMFETASVERYARLVPHLHVVRKGEKKMWYYDIVDYVTYWSLEGDPTMVYMRVDYARVVQIMSTAMSELAGDMRLLRGGNPYLNIRYGTPVEVLERARPIKHKYAIITKVAQVINDKFDPKNTDVQQVVSTVSISIQSAEDPHNLAPNPGDNIYIALLQGGPREETKEEAEERLKRENRSLYANLTSKQKLARLHEANMELRELLMRDAKMERQRKMQYAGFPGQPGPSRQR